MQSAPGAVVATEDLSRSFGSRRAVDGVTLSVGAGEALVIFGPNGAGKTTLLRLLGGLLKPGAGTASVGGVSLPGGPQVRRKIGVISHYGLLYDALTARENVEFAARLYGARDPGARAEQALSRMKVLDRADAPVRTLSRGLRQRVSVARAIVHDPVVVLADEPFTGLDVTGAAALASLLKELKESSAAVVLVTHNIAEGLGIGTHAAIMNRGRIERLEKSGGADPLLFASEYEKLVAAND